MNDTTDLSSADELSDSELLRYSRQIMLPQFDVAGQLKLKNAHVLIIGAGGLGSPVALYLASAGIGKLTIVDFDEVDDSNLQRQIIHTTDSIGSAKVESAKRSLLAINPECNVNAVNQQFGEEIADELVGRADVVVDASDNFSTRFLVNQVAVRHKKVLVSGAAIRMEGQVSVFDFRESENPCYACLYPDLSEENMTCSENGVLSPLVGIIGSVQAAETIKVIAGMGQPLVGKLMLLDAMSMEWRTVKFRKDPGCSVCG